MSEPATDAKEKTPPVTLHSDLARLCLPQAMEDATRKLAYANSICLLFLLIGLIGIKPPHIERADGNQQADVVPVSFTPPGERPPAGLPKPADETQISAPPAEVPQVAPVVAASSANVAFAVPVAGPVVVASTPQFIGGAPASPPKSGKRNVREFSAGAETGGQFPSPTYPREDLQARHEGRVLLNVVINADGTFGEISIQDSCGYSSLDRHALNWVKRHWHFPPGAVRYYLVPIQFQIR